MPWGWGGGVHTAQPVAWDVKLRGVRLFLEELVISHRPHPHLLSSVINLLNLSPLGR